MLEQFYKYWWKLQYYSQILVIITSEDQTQNQLSFACTYAYGMQRQQSTDS